MQVKPQDVVHLVVALVLLSYIFNDHVHMVVQLARRLRVLDEVGFVAQLDLWLDHLAHFLLFLNLYVHLHESSFILSAALVRIRQGFINFFLFIYFLDIMRLINPHFDTVLIRLALVD
jgi:hypothetical protein